MPCSRSPGGGIPACLAGFQPGGVSKGEVEGSGFGGSPGPPLVWGVCIPACTEADPPPMATAAGGTHPTGMHSCSRIFPS